MHQARPSSRLLLSVAFLLISLMSVHGTLAKTLVYAEYYVDADPGPGNGVALLPCDGVFDEAEEEFCTDNPSVPSLPVGRHKLFLRLMDSDSLWAKCEIVFFVTAKLQYAEYYFDTDPGYYNGIPILPIDGAIDELEEEFDLSGLPVPPLPAGRHILVLRLKDAADRWAERQTVFHLIAPLEYAEYFIDNDPGAGNAASIQPVDGVFDEAEEDFDLTDTVQSSLAPGWHILVLRLRDADGRWGRRQQQFMVSPNPYVLTAIEDAQYRIDSGPWVPLAAADGAFGESIEHLSEEVFCTGDLAIGSHTVTVRAKDSYDVWGPERTFPLRVEGCSPYKHIIAAEYFIDADPGMGLGIPLSPQDSAFDSGIEEVDTAEIQSATLSVGPHTLYLRFRDNLVDSSGFVGWGEVRSFPFMVEDMANFRVVAPNGGERWICMHTEKTIWTYPHSSVDSSVVLLSLDGGRTYTCRLGSVTAPDTALTWKSTASEAYWSDSCRVLVTYYRPGGAIMYDNSDEDFSFHSPGDADCSRDISIADAVYMVNYIFGTGIIPCQLEAMDANCDSTVDVADVVWSVKVIFDDAIPCPVSPPLPKESASPVAVAVQPVEYAPKPTIDLMVVTATPLAAVALDVNLPAAIVESCELADKLKDWTLRWKEKSESLITIGAVDLTGQHSTEVGTCGIARLQLRSVLPESHAWQIRGTAVDRGGAKLAVEFSAEPAPLERDPLPRSYALSQNFPNPFNPATTIRFALPRTCVVKLAVFNILGQHVRTLVFEEMRAGYQSVVWDGKDDGGRDVASGVYLYRLTTTEYTETKKMIMLK